MKTRTALLLATLTAACADDAQPTGWTPDLSQTIVVERGDNLGQENWDAVVTAGEYINKQVCAPVFQFTTGPEADEADRIYVYVDRDAALDANAQVQADVTDRNCYVTLSRYGRSEASATGLLACLGYPQAVIDAEIRGDVVDSLRAAKGTERCGLGHQ